MASINIIIYENFKFANLFIERNTRMAYRATGSKLMAGVSRSKDFRLTLEQLRIYKKVSTSCKNYRVKCFPTPSAKGSGSR